MPESEKEFGERFSRLFRSHIDVITKKDFPVLVAHMNECGDCADCQISAACESLREGLLKIINELPECIKNTLKQP